MASETNRAVSGGYKAWAIFFVVFGLTNLALYLTTGELVLPSPF